MSEQVSESSGEPLFGAAYRAGSSRRHSARILRKGADRTLHLVESGSGEVLTHAAPELLRREPRLGKLPSEIVFPGGWRFETMDHDGLDTILRSRGKGWLHGWEAFHPRLAVIVPAFLVLGFAIWRWGLGALVAIAVAATPAAVPRAMDDSSLLIIDRLAAQHSRLGAAQADNVRQIFARLGAATGPGPYGDYRLLFRSIPDIGPNAFAMPGGTIIVTDALIEQFPDDDIIAGVLAHEIAHASEGHVLEQLYRETGMRLLGGLVFGELGPVLERAAAEGETLLSLAFSREHEAEADRFGVALAARAGFEPGGLARLFEGLDSLEALPETSWWSTHPAPEDRIAQIRRYAEEIRGSRL